MTMSARDRKIIENKRPKNNLEWSSSKHQKSWLGMCLFQHSRNQNIIIMKLIQMIMFVLVVMVMAQSTLERRTTKINN
jgi:hypothetical protein